MSKYVCRADQGMKYGFKMGKLNFVGGTKERRAFVIQRITFEKHLLLFD